MAKTTDTTWQTVFATPLPDELIHNQRAGDMLPPINPRSPVRRPRWPESRSRQVESGQQLSEPAPLSPTTQGDLSHSQQQLQAQRRRRVCYSHQDKLIHNRQRHEGPPPPINLHGRPCHRRQPWQAYARSTDNRKLTRMQAPKTSCWVRGSPRGSANRWCCGTISSPVSQAFALNNVYGYHADGQSGDEPLSAGTTRT